MSSDERHPSGRRGRPRVPAIDDAVLDATLRLLAEQGYGRMSIDAIAEASGVSKPAIYRRWSGKAELAAAALARRIDAEAGPPANVSPEEALIAVLQQLRARLLAPNSMALVGTVLAEETQTPELILRFRDHVWERRSAALRKILDRAHSRGRLRPEVDVEATIDLLIGSLYAVYLSTGSIPKDWPERAVRTVWNGISRP